MNELFEHYFLVVTRGDPADLEKTEDGRYRRAIVAIQFAAYVAGAFMERAGCQAICADTAAAYPTSVWPEEGESKDCAVAYMARLTARNIERAIGNRPGVVPQTDPAG